VSFFKSTLQAAGTEEEKERKEKNRKTQKSPGGGVFL
jgi:hypothetical protein